MKNPTINAVAFLFHFVCIVVYVIWVTNAVDLFEIGEIIVHMAIGMNLLLLYIAGVTWFRDIRKYFRNRRKELGDHRKWMNARDKT